jgi:hypothetical protein
MAPQPNKCSKSLKETRNEVPLYFKYMYKLNKEKVSRQKTKSNACKEINLPKTGVNPHNKMIKCNKIYLLIAFGSAIYFGALLSK